jgi:hypothetical protein
VRLDHRGRRLARSHDREQAGHRLTVGRVSGLLAEASAVVEGRLRAT